MRNDNKCDLTAELVRSKFLYDFNTGFLHHRRNGTRAGYENSGYRSVKVKGKSYLEHRIIWLWITGDWPIDEVDHKDLNKLNNHWLNLRQANRDQNTYNGPTRSTRKYGTMKGAFYHKTHKRWNCQFVIDGKNTTLGWFDTELEAHECYINKANEMYGNFARAA